jgi:hypothetical protein
MTLPHTDVDFRRLADRVVALRLEGLTYREIARLTGAPFGTVSGMLTREKASNVAFNERLMAAERERVRARKRFADDPRAKRPDYGRLPMRPETETSKATSSIET